jgi:hypothetical protein
LDDFFWWIDILACLRTKHLQNYQQIYSIQTKEIEWCLLWGAWMIKR